MAANNRRLPIRKVAEREGVCVRSIERWIEDEQLKFPKPIYVRKRRYIDLGELETWERDRVTRAA